MTTRRNFFGVAAATPMAMSEMRAQQTQAAYPPTTPYPSRYNSGITGDSVNPVIDPEWQKSQIAGLRSALDNVDNISEQEVSGMPGHDNILALRSVSAVSKGRMMRAHAARNEREKIRKSLQRRLSTYLGTTEVETAYSKIMRLL